MPLIIIKLIYQVGKIKREALKNCCFLNKNYLKQYAGIEPDGTKIYKLVSLDTKSLE